MPYTNPYIDTVIVQQNELLPLTHTDYNILSALKYIELIQSGTIEQYSNKLHIAVCSNIGNASHSSDNNTNVRSIPRRVLQVVDNKVNEPLPDDIFNILHYIDINVIEQQLTDDEINKYRFVFTPQPELQHASSIQPDKSNNILIQQSKTLKRSDRIQQSNTGITNQSIHKKQKFEFNQRNINTDESSSVNQLKTTVSSTATPNSNWTFARQTDAYGHTVKQRTLLGITKSTNTNIDSKSSVYNTRNTAAATLTKQSPTKHNCMIVPVLPHTIQLKQPYVINDYPKTIKKLLYNYRVPRLQSIEQIGTHILLWIDSVRTINDNYLPLQLALFMHSRLAIPIIALLCCNNVDTNISIMSDQLLSQYSIPLITVQSDSYQQSCNIIKDYCHAMLPHSIITEELFHNTRTQYKQQLINQLIITCSFHAIDNTHITPIRYMPVNIHEIRNELYSLLYNRLQLMYIPIVDTSNDISVINMTVQSSVASIQDKLPTEFTAQHKLLVLSGIPELNNQPIMQLTIESIRECVQSNYYTVQSLIQQYVQSRSTTSCSCDTSNTNNVIPNYIQCNKSPCECNQCNVFQLLLNVLVDYHIDEIHMHLAARL